MAREVGFIRDGEEDDKDLLWGSEAGLTGCREKT